MKTLEIVKDYIIENIDVVNKDAYDIREHFNNIHNLIKDHDLIVENILTEKNINLFKDIVESSKDAEINYYGKINHKGFIDKFDEVTIHEIYTKILIMLYDLGEIKNPDLEDKIETYKFILQHNLYFKELTDDLTLNQRCFQLYRSIIWHKIQFCGNDIFHKCLKIAYELFDRLYKLDDVKDVIMINADTIFFHNSDDKAEYLKKAEEYLDGLFKLDYFKTHSGYVEDFDKLMLFPYTKDTNVVLRGFDRTIYNPQKHIFNKIYRKHYSNIEYDDFVVKIKDKEPELVRRFKGYVREQKLKRILNND
jgi:hypothetical protein